MILPIQDRGYAALLEDLADRGLLDETPWSGWANARLLIRGSCIEWARSDPNRKPRDYESGAPALRVHDWKTRSLNSRVRLQRQEQ